MPFFESLLILLLAAIVLLQVAHRFALPYPAMLAGAGVAVAMVPGVPSIPIDPHIALALFISPALLDAAFDFPLATVRRYWGPLLMLAIGSVIATVAVVALAGWMFVGLPIAAAIVLGAIVAPPDAAAATAVLSGVSIPRRTDAVLRGESLFNDATALLLFTAALTVQNAGSLHGGVVLRLAIAAPGGILLGMIAAWVMRRMMRLVGDTLGGNLLQFVGCFLMWIIAERLELSAVLTIVAFAMTLAATGAGGSPRMRVQSYAVWTAAVFVLNVLAFLLMGMQARTILAAMSEDRLQNALIFGASVVGLVIVTRIIVVMGYNRLATLRHRRGHGAQPATFKQALLGSWCGMRGLVTLATAFSLPAHFPQRDLVVLTAFAVVIGTLVVQGLTLVPVIRLLGLDRSADGAREIAAARAELALAALNALRPESGAAARDLRATYQAKLDARDDPAVAQTIEQQRALGLTAVAAQRDALERLRDENRINIDEYNLLLEELDWRELNLLPPDRRRVEEY